MADLLPIYELETQIVSRLGETRRLLLSAPTGSGKSTQVPQMLLRHGLLEQGQVVVLQPRRIAARLLAARVAEELGVGLGREVGYQVRLENVSGPATRILYVTEGILLRRMIHDPSLTGVSAVVFDEFHERHLYGDVTLARALDLQEQSRRDLMIAVMSATLDGDRLEAYLKPCARLSSEGRVYPVRIEYRPGSDDVPVWDRAADAVAGWDGGGDALVFMPGAYEISRTIEALRSRPEARGVLLLPLHGELSPRDQDAAVARHPGRKVVVATNVAETSLTIDGVRLVVDCGLARIPRYDPHRGINTLLIEKISRASADQRAGRAGRTAPGTCIRLWSERETRPSREVPEVKRLDLAEVVLTLADAGVGDFRAFRWLEPPEEKSLARAQELLGDLGALEGGRITALGRRVLAFPLHPRYARMLLEADWRGCVREAALVAALTQGRDLLLRNVDRQTERFREERFGGRTLSDFTFLTKAYAWAEKNDFALESCRRAGIHAQTARQVAPILDQFLAIAGREGLDLRPGSGADEPLRKCILIGFSDRVARRIDQGTLRCELVHGRSGTLARESAVRTAEFLVAAEVREIEGKELQTILSLATQIEPGWLRDLFPQDFDRKSSVVYEPAARRVFAEEWTLFRGLPVEKKRLESAPEEEAARLLAEEVLAGRLKLDHWDTAADQWIERVNLIARTCPELEVAPIGPPEKRALVEEICHGASSHREIKARPVLPVVRGWLNPAMADLVDLHAPERLKLSNGRSPRLSYGPDGPPYLSARIQELFGVTQIPAIALGRVRPLVHILAPSSRPVQITQDLAGFWSEHYPKLKRELQRKYPKHEWR